MTDPIFRQEALDRLSSPERLNETMEVTSPSGWIALVTTIALFAGLIAWGFLGRIPMTVDGKGVLLRPGAMKGVVALTSGQVVDVLVKPGDVVSEGMLVARLQPSSGYPTPARVDILSPQPGRVAEVLVRRGSYVSTGDRLLNLTEESDNLSAVLYLPTDTGKRVRPGMPVTLTPSTVDEQEFGHLLGTVTSVASYPASRAQMQERLGNDDLVQMFLEGGTVYQVAPIEIRVQLLRDLNTASGYLWSSPKGPNFKLSSGTVCVATIATGKRAPVDLVIPFLDRLFGAPTWSD